MRHFTDSEHQFLLARPHWVMAGARPGNGPLFEITASDALTEAQLSRVDYSRPRSVHILNDPTLTPEDVQTLTRLNADMPRCSTGRGASWEEAFADLFGLWTPQRRPAGALGAGRPELPR